MSLFGFRSFNRNWVNSKYSFATKTLIGCERGRVTNDMISCTKRGKMAEWRFSTVYLNKVSALFIWQAKNQVCLQHSTAIPVHVGSADQSKTTLFEVRLRSI